VKRPGDNQPEPEGGGAAKRREEFLRQRLQQNISPGETQTDTDSSEPKEGDCSQDPPVKEKGPSPLPPGSKP
jgi:hypothetical protein